MRTTRTRYASVILSLLWVSGCVKNPATGERQLMLLGEGQEIAMGQQAAAAIPAQLGLVDHSVEQYVAQKGMLMAKNSERPDLPWEFHVVDSPVVNAFALPGGFVYFTRGILAHMNSEAEMAAVLGHEIAHVTARHSAAQMSNAQLANLGFGLGMVFVPEVRPFGDILQTGLGLMFLKFGRDDELQADRLGVRYALNAGYDARRMGAFFDVLDQLNEQSGEPLPGWLSTHPNPSDRKQRIFALVDEASVSTATLTIRENQFKKRLDGLVYGDNPREGFMDGNTFKHPDLRFQIEFPEGWQVQNTRQAVFAGDRNAGFQLTMSRPSSRRPDEHASQVFQRFQLEAGRGTQGEIGGQPAYIIPFRARTQQGVIDGEAGFILDGDNMFELFAYTSPERYRQLQPMFRSVITSLDRLRDPAALNRQPERVYLHTVRAATTLSRVLAAAEVAEERWDELALLNQRELDETIAAGELVKLVRTNGSRKSRGN